MNYRDIETILRNDGWVWFRSHGSHRNFRHKAKRGVLTIPFHDATVELPPRIVRAIMLRAGLA